LFSLHTTLHPTNDDDDDEERGPYLEVPHVTVACAPGVRPVVSGEMLADAVVNGGYMATHEAMPLTLTGRLGVGLPPRGLLLPGVRLVTWCQIGDMVVRLVTGCHQLNRVLSLQINVV
jgi:hypothetical protein